MLQDGSSAAPLEATGSLTSVTAARLHSPILASDREQHPHAAELCCSQHPLCWGEKDVNRHLHRVCSQPLASSRVPLLNFASF